MQGLSVLSNDLLVWKEILGLYLNLFFLLICRKVYRKENRTEKNNDNETIMIKSTNCSVRCRFVLDFSAIKKTKATTEDFTIHSEKRKN